MKTVGKTLFLGILAGAAIGVGSLAYIALLSIGQKFLGSIAFSIGLLMVCFFGLNLYTGKIGFAPECSKKANILLIAVYVGNIIGAVALGYICFAILRNTPLFNTVKGIASSRTLSKTNTWLNALLKSIMCGAMVFLAVYGFKAFNNKALKAIFIIAAVTLFVYSGMEHCIANMFYISMANAWNGATVLNILVTTIGNSIGALLIYLGLGGVKRIIK